MNTRVAKLCVAAALTFVTAVAVAENPFAGTWKVDYSKSKLTGGTITFAPAASGEIRMTAGGQSYSFKLDGSDAISPFGDTAQWTKVDDKTFHEKAGQCQELLWLSKFISDVFLCPDIR